MSGANNAAAGGTSGAAAGQEFVPTANLRAMRQYEIQERYAKEDYYRQSFVMLRDFTRQQRYAEQDFYRQRMYSYRDFSIQMAFSEKMFYMQRAIAQRDFQISVSRAEYDYQLSRKRAAEDYAFSLKQIMLSGDALQYYFAQRQYNIDRTRAEEDYQLQRKRAQEDFDRQQRDSMYFYTLERAQQIKQFEIRMNDSEIEFQISRSRAAEQFDISLRDMDYQYAKERARRWEGFQEQILPEIMMEAEYRVTIEKNLTTAMVNNYNLLMSKFIEDWNGWWTQNGGNTPPPASTEQRGFGGYVGDKMYKMHDGEFVMNRSTTRAAESAAQGTLTQEKIINMLTSGGSNLVYNDSRQFSRGLDPDEKIMLRQELRQMLVDELR